jgi:U3 small nucleolar RNA-associated protein 21
MARTKGNNGASSGPVIKRQKIQDNGEKSSAPLVRQSKIFAPFRVSFIAPTDDYQG